MRPIRAVLLVAATALVPALVLTSPASAAGSPAASAIVADAAGTPADDVPVDDMSEDDLRIAILRILADENSGRGVAREATKALNDGSPEAMRAFIETGYRLAQAEDDRVATARILHKATQNGDRAVIREANRTLDTNTPEALRAFIETGYRLAQAEDDRVATARILHKATQNGDRAVIREANRTLDTNTPEALRAFIETGYRLAQAEDDRVATARILHKATQNGDRAVIREANRTLDTNTPEALRAFIETGYRLAQAEDDRVAVARILADPTISDALRAAAEVVIDGTPDELRYFVVTGQYEIDG